MRENWGAAGRAGGGASAEAPPSPPGPPARRGCCTWLVAGTLLRTICLGWVALALSPMRKAVISPDMSRSPPLGWAHEMAKSGKKVQKCAKDTLEGRELINGCFENSFHAKPSSCCAAQRSTVEHCAHSTPQLAKTAIFLRAKLPTQCLARAKVLPPYSSG